MEQSQITFNWRDEYGRKQVAETLVNGILEGAPILPLLLHGEWGSGKTEFATKTINLLSSKSEEYIPVYLDAYKTDYHDDPLIALSAAVVDSFPKNEQAELKKKVIPVVRSIGKLGLKALCSWTLKQEFSDVTDDFEKDLKKASDAQTDVLIDTLLEDQMSASKNLESLKKHLEKATEDKKLIFFIDELDRCKPTYAVQLVELVKHVFDVPGVNFIFVINRTQMEASINHHYGPQIDAKRYLDKFIAFSLELPLKLKSYGSVHTTVMSKGNPPIFNRS